MSGLGLSTRVKRPHPFATFGEGGVQLNAPLSGLTLLPSQNRCWHGGCGDVGRATGRNRPAGDRSDVTGPG